ncbi:protein YgfX [Dyella silvatica]|uniref:protein YgfX n=1 Tax=Dyella silvatica TaxID=2992128 RepID=UPI002257AE6A|nr:protein YgfX [Dyella silvatica]
MTSAPAIGFEYRASRLFLCLLIGMALLAMLAVICCGLPWWAKCLLLMVTLAAVVRAIRHAVAGQVTAVGWTAAGDWSLRMSGGADALAMLGSFRVLGSFVLLRLVLPDRRSVSLLLAPDNSDADTRRRLRMRLAAIKPDEALPRL